MSTESKNWSDSRQYCRDHGADLIIINTEDKQVSLCECLFVRSPGPVSSHSPPEGAISLPPGLIYLTPHTCAPTHHFPAGLNHRGLFRHLTPVPLSGKITHTHMCVCSLFSQHYVAVWGVLFLIIVLFLPVGFLFIKEPKLTCIWT